MRYLLVIIISLVVGFIYGLTRQADNDAKTDVGTDPNVTYTQDFQPVDHVYDTPNDPPIVQEKIVKPNDSELFKPGQEVTCIYNGVFSWSDGNQFMKTIALTCTVIEASEPWDNSSYGQSPIYQHIHVDCTKSVIKNTGSPGVGLVPKHPLNFKKRWLTTDDCYHFVQEN